MFSVPAGASREQFVRRAWEEGRHAGRRQSVPGWPLASLSSPEGGWVPARPSPRDRLRGSRTSSTACQPAAASVQCVSRDLARSAAPALAWPHGPFRWRLRGVCRVDGVGRVETDAPNAGVPLGHSELVDDSDEVADLGKCICGESKLSIDPVLRRGDEQDGERLVLGHHSKTGTRRILTSTARDEPCLSRAHAPATSTRNRSARRSSAVLESEDSANDMLSPLVCKEV
jgi:hypothetical protein